MALWIHDGYSSHWYAVDSHKLDSERTIPMHSLIGDRFLMRFLREIKRGLKSGSASNGTTLIESGAETMCPSGDLEKEDLRKNGNTDTSENDDQLSQQNGKRGE
ncbi:MAG: hypothetical protein ACOYZ8_12920 [Chloroflexota bacterium]